ncbi:MAG: hypothetical protein V1755_15850 [Chloroflexota bacterium]
MTWRTSILLAGLGLGVALTVARFQPFPGYLDSDYYFGGGVQLARGNGFSEPYLWNYLDDPQGLPHPSHTYWMPLASILAAAGMWLTGQTSYAAGRLGFLALAAAAPVLTAALAHAFSRKRELALVSGLLSVFSIYYVPFLPVPDNYGVYLVLGALFFLTMGRRHDASYLVMGLLAGLMTLARSDGVLWLALAGVAAVLSVRPLAPGEVPESPTPAQARVRRGNIMPAVVRIALAVGGFVLITAPWWLRSYSTHGAVVAPGGERLLWLTTYDDMFAYPAEQLTYDRWIGQGLPGIVSDRLTALRWNLLNAFAAQGGVFLFPFILVGAWLHRRDVRVQIGILGWFSLLVVMTAIFPFAGARGGFFHAGASIQSLWWTLAPLGLESIVAAARRRGMFTPQAFAVFTVALVGIAALMTAIIFSIRVLPGWGEGEQAYPRIEAFLERSGAKPDEVVMVRNPPGYYILTGRPAIVVPYAGPSDMLAAARRYDARYLVIERAGAAGPINAVYADLRGENFEYLGELDGSRIFRVRP